MAALGSMGALTPNLKMKAEQTSLPPLSHITAQIPPRKVEWPSTTYRRLLIDTHVPDWDSLLTDFNAAEYVSTVSSAGFQSLMQYANSHVGLCLYRTKLGEMHKGMRGRDYFGEVMQECDRHGLVKLAYYSLIFDDWAYQNHPDWRILPDNGYDDIFYSRTGTVCPNSPYRDHAMACLRELVGNYDFKGMFIDMTFWPAVCYCPYCAERFKREHGHELPRTVDWKDSVWRSFQKAREQWMLEFAMTATKTIKQVRPIDVAQQFSTAFDPWQSAVSLEQNDASDFCSGDFYGGVTEFSLVCKTYWGMTRTRPFEFMTSRTRNLSDFETTKTLDSILVESFVPTIHSSACLLIDAIKPLGKLDQRAYEYFSQVNAQHDPFEPFLGGEMLADVAIYFDKESLYDPDENGKPVSQVASPTAFAGPRRINRKNWVLSQDNPPHLNALTGAARILREHHIPFGVVTNATLDQLSRYRAVILPSVLEMTTGQASQFREFVRNGGVLYASGPSSLGVPGEGESKFLLEDVFGVSYLDSMGSNPTYLSPANPDLYKLIWPQDCLTFPGKMVRAKAQPGTEVLATVTLPFVDPDVGYSIGTHFAQIWSDPPASQPGRDPGIVVNSYGKGKTIWVAAPIESQVESVYSNLVAHLLQRTLPRSYHFELDAHPAVEMTLFDQVDKHRMLVGLLNMQTGAPPISVGGTVRVHLPAGRTARRVLALPEQTEIHFQKSGPYVQFEIAPFQIIKMALVEYA
jgi:hypothetical protein